MEAGFARHALTELPVELPYPKVVSGKVREVYDLGDDKLLIWSSDRISAFDVVMKTGIPGKGIVLNTFSVWWFQKTKHIWPNHFITDDVCAYLPELSKFETYLRRRSMIVTKHTPLPVEFVVRGMLVSTGSAWKEYSEQGTICGMEMPGGLQPDVWLDRSIITPATKATTGHDINISTDKVREVIGKERADYIFRKAMEVYHYQRDVALQRGLCLLDTKYEASEDKVQIDESGTPDSSRYFPDYSKQPFRNWLNSIHFDRETPIEIPDEVGQKTSWLYCEGLRQLTGIRVW